MKTIVLLTLALLLALAVQSCSFTLVDSRKGHATVVLAEKASAGEVDAANELVKYIGKMTECTLAIQKTDRLPEGNVVIIGRHPEALNLAGQDLTQAKLGFDGIVIKSFSNKLVLVGMNDTATKYAVVDFLKRLGCRFYLPHPDGEVIPSRKKITVSRLNIVHKPDFAHRVFWNNGDVYPTLAHPNWYTDWAIRTYQGGVNIMHGHNYTGFVPDEMFAEHPEYFPLIKAAEGKMKRVIQGQRCISNPDVVKLAAEAAIAAFDTDKTLYSYSLSPNDGLGWCECDKCKAMDDPDPTIGLGKRVLTFTNQVAEIVSKKYPDKWLFYYAEYGNIPGPPKDMKAHPMVMIGIVNYYDPLHDLFDKNSASNQKYLKRLNIWKKASKQQFVYEWYQYSTLPTPFVYTVGDRIKFYKDMGVKGYSGEIIGKSPVNDIAMYIAAQMLWDSSQNPKKMLSEFFKLYFAETAKPMEEYYQLLHKITYYSNNQNCRTLERDWSESLIKDLHRKLDQAKALAVSEVVKRRLDREQKSLDITDYVSSAFRSADKWGEGDIVARARGRYAAQKAIDLLEQIPDEDIVAEAMILRQVRMLKASVLDSDTPVTSNSAKMQPGWSDKETFADIWAEYEEIGTVPIDWKFKLDPDNVGRKEAWFGKDLDYSNWDNIRIAEFWEAQGYPDYNGYAWYRTKLAIPSAAAGRKIVLYFGAADEAAYVWVNGKLAGKSEGDPDYLWDKSFPIDITDYAVPGETCEVAVQVHDGGAAGGLWKNIKLVSPK